MSHFLSQPPPGDNVAVAAWYRSGKALDAVEQLRSEIELTLLRELGALSKKMDDANRDAKRFARQSDTDLRKHWEEDSSVRNLRAERDRALRQCEDLRKVTDLRKRRTVQWTADFVKILLAAVAGAILRSLFAP